MRYAKAKTVVQNHVNLLLLKKVMSRKKIYAARKSIDILIFNLFLIYEKRRQAKIEKERQLELFKTAMSFSSR